MERNARIILVCSFVLFSALAAFFFYRWIMVPDADNRFEQRTIEFNGSVSGLSVGSEVRYLGVAVGRVASIQLSRAHLGRVEVVMATDQRLPPSEQLIARLEPLGITGLSLVALQNRPPEMEVFDVDAAIIPGFPSFVTQLSGSAGRITATLEESLDNLQVLLDKDSIADMDATLRHTRELSANLAAASRQFESIMSGAGRIEQELENTLPDFRRVARQLETEVLPGISDAADALREASDSVAGAVGSNREQIDNLLQRELPTLVGVTDELAQTLREINRLADTITSEPGGLLYGERPREVEIPND